MVRTPFAQIQRQCFRYIELNSVLAVIVDDPEDCAWSSYRAMGQAMPDAVTVPLTGVCARTD